MRMITTEYTNQSQGVLASKSLGISAKAASKILYQILTAQVSDKTGYPVREYSTNAWEVSPKGKPFELELPTRFNPVIRWRDFGPGLSPKFMINRYPQVGDSTKDGDDEAVGGWGNGSKSALSYLMRDDGAGSYTVRSFYRGTVSTYSIGISPKGGIQIECLDQSPTDEPSGLEVSFPVREKDIQTFHDRAHSILWSFNPWPVITPKPDWKEPKVLSKGNGWTLYDGNTVPFTGPQVRMGPVMYRLDLNQISNRTSFVQWGDEIIFDAPIGSVKVTSSREGLQYEAQTIETVEKLLAAYETDFAAGVQAKVDLAETYFKAHRVFEDETRALGQDRQRAIMRHISWKDLRLVETVTSDTVKGYVLGHAWESFDRFDRTGIHPHLVHDAKIVIENVPYRSLDRFHTLGLVGQKIVWFRVKKKDTADFLASIGNPEHVILDSAKVTRTWASSPTGSRPKTVRTRRMISVNRDQKEEVDLAAGGLYMSRIYGGRRGQEEFRLSYTTSIRQLYQIKSLLRSMTELNFFDEPIKILIPNPDDVLNDDWVEVGEYLEMLLKDRCDLSKIDLVSEQRSTRSLDDQIRDLGLPEPKVSFADGPEDLQQFQIEVQAAYAHLSADKPAPDENRKVFDLLKSFTRVEAPKKEVTCPSTAVNERWEELKEKYPLLQYILANHGYYSYGGAKNHLPARLSHYFELLNK